MNQRKGKVDCELLFLISVSIHVQIIIEFLSTAIKFIETESSKTEMDILYLMRLKQKVKHRHDVN